MKRLLVTLLALSAAQVMAADPPGYVRWSAAELKGFSAKLAAAMGVQKAATERLGNFGNHYFMAAYREADGEAEIHETQTDIFIVQAGEATLVVGGQIEGGKTTAPGEIRGTSIKNGQAARLGPGDIVHIPAKTPHQTLVKPGQKITYLVVKIAAP
jgi:mannose-6-phosphate isomerase-like protein (cupin superfamily)